ncbi:MAG: phage tail tip lysozyme [Yoonia sp.]
MDPQLWEEIARGDEAEEIDAIVRLDDSITPPDNIRVVARFGPIATCRLLRRDIIEVRAHPAVLSLKASRRLVGDEVPSTRRPVDAVGTRRRPRVRETGAGVIVGVIDYGCDFVHAAFRNRDGTTRLRWLWHQGAPTTDASPEPYRKGRLISREEINAALQDDDPYAALGYYPTRRRARRGSHGTHVLDIAAGNGRGRGPTGMAPAADIIFVHVATGRTSGLSNFGDSVGVMEAVDFIANRAGDQPCVINISMGRHGGPHDGTTLIERGFDAILAARRGFSIVQSAGNYHSAQIHCQGRFASPGDRARMAFRVQPDNDSTKEVEVWYPAADVLDVRLTAPDGRSSFDVPPDERVDIVIGRDTVGRAYHRLGDPGNGDTHVDIFIYDSAPDGRWRLELTARSVRDGNWHAWIERDGDRADQTRFVAGPVSKATTGGTIAHGRGPIQVAAHDGADRLSRRYTSFSSAGPSRDGRATPFVAAPGKDIIAARSALRGVRSNGREVMIQSGTSMASPHVAGLVALMLEAFPRAGQRQLRGFLARTARPIRGTVPSDGTRSAHGAIAAVPAIRQARRAGRASTRSSDAEAWPVSALDTGTDTEAVVASAEWPLIENWILVGAVPTDGAGALPTNRSVPQSALLPAIPEQAARFLAQGLINRRNVLRRIVGAPAPMPARPAAANPSLDPLARLILPALPPTHNEWQEVGRFIEAQLNIQRAGTGTGMIGTNDTINRRNLAHHIACQRLVGFPGSVASPASPYCTYPQVSRVDSAIALLMQALTRLGPILDWARIPADDRYYYVMDRLIRVHGFSRNAAAGLVGNMIHESGVLPERIEGSAAATPRYAPRRQRSGNPGARRRHSATSVRTRPIGGPHYGGIGLVQWTSGRRAYLFGLQPAGVAIGDFVIYFMDAQIDGVAAELQRSYRRVNRFLRRAGVTRDAAADEVVYRYEIPGRVLRRNPNPPPRMLLRPRNDPQVQRVFRARRAGAATADAAYGRVLARLRPTRATAPATP